MFCASAWQKRSEQTVNGNQLAGQRNPANRHYCERDEVEM
jgi:hypothetical protein